MNYIQINRIQYFLHRIMDHPLLSSDNKKLMNVLELKIYDLTQTIEIIGQQLTFNQIKSMLAAQFSIFSQMLAIYKELQVEFLFELNQKIQINSITLNTILIKHLQKISINNDKNKEISKSQSQFKVEQEKVLNTQPTQELTNRKINKFGGISLYNQNYIRGIEYSNINQVSEQKGKIPYKVTKKTKEQLMESVLEQINHKTDVEVQNLNDQITNFINQRKLKDLVPYISYQEELTQIIQFFKTSELEAISFLNSSPNNDQNHDFYSAVEDIEKDMIRKKNINKQHIHHKMKQSIQKLKQKMTQIEQYYLQQNMKLKQYERSLKKATSQMYTQTYDNYQQRIVYLQQQIKQQQQKYVILHELKKNQNQIEDKMFQVKNQLQIKILEINKLKFNNQALEEEIFYLKKVIRDNKDKITLPFDFQKIRSKKKFIIPKEKSYREIIDKTQQSINERYRQRKQRKYEKLSTRMSKEPISRSSANRTSMDQTEVEIIPSLKEIKKSKTIIQDQKNQNSRSRQRSKEVKISNKEHREVKQSNFKNEIKKIQKPVVQASNTSQNETKQVSFVSQNPGTNFIVQDIRESNLNQQSNKEDRIKNNNTKYQRQDEVNKSMISIDEENFERYRQSQPPSQKMNRKFTIRNSDGNSKKKSEQIQVKYQNHDHIDQQKKKSSKNVSRKCIILKQKSVLSLSLKQQHLQCEQVLNLIVNAAKPFQKSQSVQVSEIQINKIGDKRQLKKQSLHNLEKQIINLTTTIHRKRKLKSFKNDIKQQKKHLTQSKQKEDSFFSKVKKQNINSVMSNSKKQETIFNDSTNNYQSKLALKQSKILESQNASKPIWQVLQNFQLYDRQSEHKSHFHNQQYSRDESVMTYLLEQVQGGLDIDEFKQIMKVVENSAHTPKKQPKSKASYTKQRSNAMKKELSPIKQEKQQNHLNKNLRQLFFSKIGHIKSVHYQNQQRCKNQKNICCHLLKYFQIFKKISDKISVRQKDPMQLPIQKIGFGEQRYSNLSKQDNTKIVQKINFRQTKIQHSVFNQKLLPIKTIAKQTIKSCTKNMTTNDSERLLLPSIPKHVIH